MVGLETRMLSFTEIHGSVHCVPLKTGRLNPSTRRTREQHVAIQAEQDKVSQGTEKKQKNWWVRSTLCVIEKIILKASSRSHASHSPKTIDRGGNLVPPPVPLLGYGNKMY